MNFIKQIFSGFRKKPAVQEKEFSQEEYDLDYEEKKKGLEQVLGEMHDLVGHAIIPFAIGGSVDMYYFTRHIPGTGFASMELLNPDGKGPMPNRLGTYELVAFTKQPYNNDEEKPNAFNLMERHICGIFTTIGNYGTRAILNPYETCEIPSEDKENGCLLFDNYQPGGSFFMVGERKHHLLLCLEVFRTEMDFARENGSEALLDKLKMAGFYPYSDLDREPVA